MSPSPRLRGEGWGVLLETMMGTIKLRPWNSAEHLKTEEDIALYLEACMEGGDPALIEHAHGVTARARQKIREGNRECPTDGEQPMSDSVPSCAD